MKMIVPSFIWLLVLAVVSSSAFMIPREDNDSANNNDSVTTNSTTAITGIPGLNRTQIYAEVQNAIATLPKDTLNGPQIFSYDSNQVASPTYLLPNFRQGKNCHLVTTIEQGRTMDYSSWANITAHYLQMNDMLNSRGGHCVQSIIGKSFFIQLGIECVNVERNETLVNPDPTAFRTACMVM